MTVDFQLQLLSYLVQCSEAERYIEQIDDSIFDLLEDKLTLQILKKYYKTYQGVPSKVSFINFAEDLLAVTPNLSSDTIKNLRNNFENIYYPLSDGDKGHVRDKLILSIQEKEIDITFMNFASGKMNATQVFTRMDKLRALVKPSDTSQYDDGGFLIQDRYKHFDEQVNGNPTFLHDLNRLTAAGGFYYPQLIIFLSGPKSFKTGLLLILGLEYARGGMKVYYADNENGAGSIRKRAKQALMGCELHELDDPEIKEELDSVLYRFGHYMNGDLFIDSYKAYATTVGDVRNRLAYLKEKYEWSPDVIIYDTIDKFSPTNPVDQKRDVRIKIQLVYDEVINLNKEMKMFAFAPSQVNRGAIGKKVFDIRDVSEDLGKVFNCHACFAICGTPQEEQEGIRRIVPVVQREGVAYKGVNFSMIRIDEARMKIKEVDKDEKEEYLNNLQDD
jgi:hypothetical protein